jgi:hypothetical protein
MADCFGSETVLALPSTWRCMCPTIPPFGTCAQRPVCSNTCVGQAGAANGFPCDRHGPWQIHSLEGLIGTVLKTLSPQAPECDACQSNPLAGRPRAAYQCVGPTCLRGGRLPYFMCESCAASHKCTRTVQQISPTLFLVCGECDRFIRSHMVRSGVHEG